MIDQKLYLQAEQTVNKLKEKGMTVATAESCTGGTVSSYITAVSGVSTIFELGVTSYSCRIKNGILGVSQETLDRFGAVSEQTAKEMAENVRRLAGSDLGASVTGVAGPQSSEGHPPGYVFIAVAGQNGTQVKLLDIEPKSRNFVKNSATAAVFELINSYIEVL
ncbi:MAG: nicotinamide-nucleotide amidohydrolase family protein [Clostridia bacterium]|nr:nicotinamide-nucleotide amidohydrolase family protein [Clostridia bacterium]